MDTSQPTGHHAIELRSPEITQCIDDCSACSDICQACIPHCLAIGGPHAAPDHITTLLACAAACDFAAQLMRLGTPIKHDACDTCAEACDACAVSCDAIGGDDRMMQDCAEMCRRCAGSCRAMVAH
jgi:hypothetical protein